MKVVSSEYWIKATPNNESACQFHAIDNGEEVTIRLGFGRAFGSVVLAVELPADSVDSLIAWLQKWRARMEVTA